MKYEKPTSGNKRRLTISQHVIPKRTIERFTRPNGFVEVTFRDGRMKLLKPDAGIFCMTRVWDQRAESGYMKQIEDQFQALARRICAGDLSTVPDEAVTDVNRFFSLWYHRSRIRLPDEIVTHVNGLHGEGLSKEQHEILEAKHIMAAREGSKVATRHLVGIQIQSRIMADEHSHSTRPWGIIQAPKGEFVVPDIPAHDLMPIAPTILLAANHSSGTLTRENLAAINAAFVRSSHRYFFARDTKVALEGIDWTAVSTTS